PGSFNPATSKVNADRDGLQPGNAARTLANSTFAPRQSSLGVAPSPAPGSFSSNLRSQLAPSRTNSGQDVNASMVNLERLGEREDEGKAPEQVLSALRESLNREMKIKEGSENM